MQKTSFMLFSNKFDIFKKKILKVRLVRTLYTIIGGGYYHFGELINVTLALYRSPLMYASGSKITSQFPPGVKGLSMHIRL